MTTIEEAIAAAESLQRAGNLQEAARICEQIAASHPHYFPAWHLLGLIAHQARRADMAAAYLARAVQLRPDSAEAHIDLGTTFFDLGRFSEAIEHYGLSLTLKPDYVIGWCNLGNAWQAQRQFEAAVDCYRHALTLQPDFAEAHSNLGNALVDQGQLSEAATAYRRAIELNPELAEAHINLGTLLVEEGNREEGAACYERALQLRPLCAEARWGRSVLALIGGDFERGWPEFEWRWKTGRITVRDFAQPRWTGETFVGRTILLYAEQGLGDTFQFVRYAQLVKERGGTVVVECQRTLTRLLARCPGIDRLVGHGDALPQVDVQAPLLSLPGIVGTTLEAIPASVPYVFADAGLIDLWREKLAKIDAGLSVAARATKPFRIGVHWAGRTTPGFHKRRDIPIEHFVGLTAIPGVILISLQKQSKVQGPMSKVDAGEFKVQSSKFKVEEGAVRGSEPSLTRRVGVVDFGEELDAEHGAFMDTAAIMMNLDLVITSDTSVAHLAGALGVSVWVALPYVPDWRWMLERSDSPWYPTMRLFRQKMHGDWAGVFQEIEAELREQIGASGKAE